MMRATIFGFLALAGCAVAAAEPVPSPATPGESVSFEAKSWGKPLSSWTVERLGAGRYTFSRKVPSGRFGDYDLVTRAFRITPADYARLEKLLAPARAFAGRELPCSLTITDQVYGRVRWKQGEEVAFNLGCTSNQVRPIYDNFGQAETLVKRLAEAGTIIETKEVRESGR